MLVSIHKKKKCKQRMIHQIFLHNPRMPGKRPTRVTESLSWSYLIKSPCQDPAGNQTIRRPDDRKETQNTVAWSRLPFIRSGQKTILQGTVNGGRRQGRQKKRGGETTSVVVRSSVVPYQLWWLRDRWRWIPLWIFQSLADSFTAFSTKLSQQPLTNLTHWWRCFWYPRSLVPRPCTCKYRCPQGVRLWCASHDSDWWMLCDPLEFAPHPRVTMNSTGAAWEKKKRNTHTHINKLLCLSGDVIEF